jgi:hypothetical protein
MTAARTRHSKTSAPKAEVRRFGMHPKLLLDVIQRQAGSLAKAILEGVMNSIDAGCTKCKVYIYSNNISIDDDGKGITERTQIETFFETFGQPHDESEGKTYGTFRMGRGQMFAYGVNCWRTGPFEMTVNIRDHGLDYELKSGLKVDKGCTIGIGLYEPLDPSALAETLRTIRQWVKYAPVPVFINGEKASLDPKNETWDHVTDEAYIRLGGNGGLALYNLGVHTMDFSGYRFGTGGVIVSRKQLRVNFARNDVQSDCPVWRKIKPFVDQKAREKVTRKPDLSDDERQRLADLVKQGETVDLAIDQRLFTSVNGRHYSAKQMYTMNHKYSCKITHCHQGDRVGDRVFQQNLAFVLANTTLARFETDVEGIVKIVRSILNGAGRRIPADYRFYTVVPFKDISGTISDKHSILADAEQTVVEKMWLDMARCALNSFRVTEYVGLCEAKVPNAYGQLEDRKLVIGTSDSADGWTDGETYIAIDRKFMGTLTCDTRGITDLAMLVLHEMCHEGPDTAEHVHSQEFYENFHNQAQSAMAKAVFDCIRRLPAALKLAGKSLPKELLKEADHASRTWRSLRGLAAEADSKKWWE